MKKSCHYIYYLCQWCPDHVAEVNIVENGHDAIRAKQLGDLLLSIDQQEASQPGTSSNKIRTDKQILANKFNTLVMCARSSQNDLISDGDVTMEELVLLLLPANQEGTPKEEVLLMSYIHTGRYNFVTFCESTMYCV